MPFPTDWSERRSRRTSCLAEALRFQLDACREQEGLEAIVVSDQLGFCVAHSGGGGEHAELAAQLPILGHGTRARSEAEEDPTDVRRTLIVTSFSAAGETLHAGAVSRRRPEGEPASESLRAALDRVASGFSRMLAQ
jgi:hypothetical protein